MKKPLSFLLLMCLGCSTADLKPPAAALSDLRLGAVSLFETSLVALVRLENDNPAPLSVEGAAYRLYLNGIDLGRGVSDERLTIPRLGSAVQKVNFTLSNLTLLSEIRSLIDARDFSYRIEGQLYLPGALGFPRSLPLAREGRFSFGAAADAQGERP